MHIHINNYIDSHLIKKVTRELDAMTDLLTDGAVLTVIINSGGGMVSATYTLIQVLKLILQDEPGLNVNFIISGQCCSAAVDFVLAFKDNPKVTIYLSKHTEVLLHKMRLCSLDSLATDSQKIWRELIKEDTRLTIEAYSPYITKAQVSSILKGKDVYIDYTVASKLFNAQLI